MTDTQRDHEPVDILIVDDRSENLLAVEAILEPLGENLVRASSGEDALRCLLERDIAVILLDVQMPGMNGFETAQMIKSRERSKYIPIIFLTAISKEQEYVFQGYEVGAVDYIFKPFQPEILRSKVSVFVDLYVQQRRITEQEQRLRESERQDLELRHMRELLQSEARFREIVDSAMDAIIVFDPGGSVSMINWAAERMFGAKLAEANGQPVERFFPEGVSADVVSRICAIAERQRADAAEGRLVNQPVSLTGRRTDGETFPIEASVSCLEGNEGFTYTLIVRDVSDRLRHEEVLRRQAASLASSAAELKKLNDELHRRQVDLERAMTARSRFYASMSHELRTPINAVLGYSTLLLERIYGPLNEKQAEGIERTQKAARHLLELVNDVLDLSKIEAGKIDLRLQPVDFPGLIEDLFVTVRPLADEHGSPLSIGHEGPPVRIVSDPRRLRQILLNLLSNAIKFGRGNPIRVNIIRGENGSATVEVRDQGEGIPADDQERIFDEFVQLGKTQLQDGTGLGLPISRRLAEILGGSLTVESTVGTGSVFRLTVPRTYEPRLRMLDQEVPTLAASERAFERAGDRGDVSVAAARRQS